MSQQEEITVLKLSLHDQLVGYLIGYQHGRNVLKFADEFRSNSARPTFSLITHPNFPNAQKVMSEPWFRKQRLPPTLSNLLPEGALRELIAQALKVHVNNEFHILLYLGEDLPGALIVKAVAPEEVPRNILGPHSKATEVRLNNSNRDTKFSLAGVQMKFSMKEMDGRYNLNKGDDLGDWIIKTPSTLHQDVPLNEYTAMSLAAMAGINIPEIKLIEVNKLENLPPINLPHEEYAFAIKRFDRNGNQRIHMEDFAQVLVKYPDEKYGGANYEQIGNILYTYSGDGIADAQQFARRLLVNILLGNGDAHLKNWSLLYSDRITPRLSPAYDIVTTNAYIDDEREFALNLAKNKDWFTIDFSHFKRWATNANIPWRAIEPHLNDTLERARELWPDALKSAPMNEKHKETLKEHWSKLRDDFKITTH